MSLTVKSIYHETENFFRNQFITFLLIALLCALIKVAISHVFSSSFEQINYLNQKNHLVSRIDFLELVQNMTLEQQKILLKAAAVTVFSNLVSNTILVGGVLPLIQLVSARQRANALCAISVGMPMLPNLFILIFLITLLVQIGILLMIIPGILLTIAFALAPILLVQENLGTFPAICSSIKLVFANARLVSPAVVVWLLTKLLLLILAPYFISLIPNIGVLVIYTLNNLISAMLLVYLFRLYMLIIQ